MLNMFERIIAVIKGEKKNMRKGMYIVLVFSIVLIIAIVLFSLFERRVNDNSGRGGLQGTTTKILTSEEKRIIEEAFRQSQPVTGDTTSGQKASLEKKFNPAINTALSEEEKHGIENNFNNINNN